MENQNDSSCESDLSDGWAVLGTSISEHDTTYEPNVNSNPGESSDAESLEVMEVERGPQAFQGSHDEDLMRPVDTDTDGISIISESDSSCPPELMDTVLVLPPKQRKYVHNSSPYINMWLSLMLVISLAITVGLGIGHYLGSARSMKAAELIRQLRDENFALEQRITDLFSQNEYFRSELDSALNELFLASNRCSISDELYCRSYCDESVDKNNKHSFLGPVLSSDGVHNNDDVVVYSPSQDGTSGKESCSESMVKPGITDPTSGNNKHTVGSLVSDIFHLSCKNVKDSLKDMPSSLSDGYKMLEGLKDKASNMHKVLGKWSNFVLENVKLNLPKEKPAVKNIKESVKEEITSEFFKHYQRMAEEKCEQALLSFSSRSAGSDPCHALINNIFSLSEPFYRFHSKFKEFLKPDETSKNEQVDQEFVSVETFEKNNLDESEDTEWKTCGKHHETCNECTESQGEPVEINVPLFKRGSVDSFQSEEAEPAVAYERYKDSYAHDTKYIYYYDNADINDDDDIDKDDDSYDDSNYDDNDDDDDDDDDNDDDDYKKIRYLHSAQKEKDSVKSAEYNEQYVRDERKPKQKDNKRAKHGKHSKERKLKNEKNINYYKNKEKFSQNHIIYYNHKSKSYKKYEKYGGKHNYPKKYKFTKEYEKSEPLRLRGKNKQLLNETGNWLMKMYEGRAEHRRANHQSDWVFDRAEYRKSKREDENRSHWYFARAHIRRQCRTHPRPDWCSYDQSAHKEESNKDNWRRDYEKVDGHDHHRHQEYHSRSQKDWKLKHIPKYWKRGKRIISQAFMAASKFLKS